MSEVHNPYRRDPEARQFSIRRLLLLALLCAIVGATGQVLELPPTGQVIFTFWWMILAAYLVLRLPYVVLAILGRTSRGKRLKAHRAELKEMTARKRREYREKQKDKSDAE
jgi:amino acid permease